MVNGTEVGFAANQTVFFDYGFGDPIIIGRTGGDTDWYPIGFPQRYRGVIHALRIRSE